MRSKVSPFTWLGLFISLFGFIALRFTFRTFGVSNSITADVWREFAVWILAAFLIVLVRFGEGLPLRSIGLGTAPWRRSLRYGCILTGLCQKLPNRLVSASAGYATDGPELFLRSWLSPV
jgi:hypothetical protein